MEKYPGNWTTRQRPTQQKGMRCWALALALMIEQGYRAITPKRARFAPPHAAAPARPAGAAALLEAFGL